MTLAREHDLHRRRLGRNLGLGLVLAAFAGLIFGLTIIKMADGGSMRGYDHTRHSLEGGVPVAVTEPGR